jgi:hypothetical protein
LKLCVFSLAVDVGIGAIGAEFFLAGVKRVAEFFVFLSFLLQKFLVGDNVELDLIGMNGASFFIGLTFSK